MLPLWIQLAYRYMTGQILFVFMLISCSCYLLLTPSEYSGLTIPFHDISHLSVMNSVRDWLNNSPFHMLLTDWATLKSHDSFTFKSDSLGEMAGRLRSAEASLRHGLSSMESIGSQGFYIRQLRDPKRSIPREPRWKLQDFLWSNLRCLRMSLLKSSISQNRHEDLIRHKRKDFDITFQWEE